MLHSPVLCRTVRAALVPACCNHSQGGWPGKLQLACGLGPLLACMVST